MLSPAQAQGRGDGPLCLALCPDTKASMVRGLGSCPLPFCPCPGRLRWAGADFGMPSRKRLKRGGSGPTIQIELCSWLPMSGYHSPCLPEGVCGGSLCWKRRCWEAPDGGVIEVAEAKRSWVLMGLTPSGVLEAVLCILAQDSAFSVVYKASLTSGLFLLGRERACLRTGRARCHRS